MTRLSTPEKKSKSAPMKSKPSVTPSIDPVLAANLAWEEEMDTVLSPFWAARASYNPSSSHAFKK